MKKSLNIFLKIYSLKFKDPSSMLKSKMYTFIDLFIYSRFKLIIYFYISYQLSSDNSFFYFGNFFFLFSSSSAFGGFFSSLILLVSCFNHLRLNKSIYYISDLFITLKIV